MAARTEGVTQLDGWFTGVPRTREVVIYWPGPISIGILEAAARQGYVLQRWTPEAAVFVSER